MINSEIDNSNEKYHREEDIPADPASIFVNVKSIEEKYRLISENMSDLICLYSIYMKPLYISPSIKEILGYEPEELKGKSIYGLFHPDDLHPLKISLEKILVGDNIEHLEHRIMSKNGSYIWFETIVKPVMKDSKIVRILTSSRNITERKKMENNLIEEIQFNRQIILSAQEGIIVYDCDLKYVEWNPYMENLTGLKSEEVIGWTPGEIFPSLKELGIVEKLKRALNGETVKSGDTYLYIQRNGKSFWTSGIYAPLRDAQGKIIGVIGTIRDISEQKCSEELLWIKNFAIESSINAIIMMDLNGKLTYINHSFMELWKYDADKEVLGKPYQELWQDREQALCVIRELYKSGKWTGEITALAGDNTEFDVHVSAFTVNNKDGNPLCLMASFIDITEKLNLEKNLRQSQKIEAIGNLAGGIAHDFNNILGTIFGHTEILLKEFHENSPFEKNLLQILKSAQRARDLVKQILAFSRKGEQEKKLLKVSDIIKESIKFLRASLPSTIQINQEFEDNESIIFADRTQIYQILMNLCLNSAHAMRERCGMITISLKDIFISEEDTLSDSLNSGPYVKLTVTDNGHGINKDIFERIFEPYFTTKTMDEGTGLGLSVVHGIVKSYYGDINVYSEEGKGATFEILLPRVEADNTDDSGDLLPVKGGAGKILFVDDEIDLAEVSTMILLSLGYEVTTVSDSPEALKIFKENPYKFDLVITDQTMPYMTGDELAKTIISIRKDIPIILVTGFSEIINSERAKSSGIKEFILKPLSMRGLAETVGKLLVKK
jgi:PAS domain S-box-containing protein